MRTHTHTRAISHTRAQRQAVRNTDKTTSTHNHNRHTHTHTQHERDFNDISSTVFSLCYMLLSSPLCCLNAAPSLWSHDIFLCHFYCPTVRTVWWQHWDTSTNAHYVLIKGCAAHATHFLLSLLTSILLLFFFFIFSADDDDAKSQMRLVTVWRHACMDVIHTKREKILKWNQAIKHLALSVNTTTVSEHRKNSRWPDDITAGGGEFESPATAECLMLQNGCLCRPGFKWDFESSIFDFQF